ncbi:unnamed protein product [Amoebophrya sp. A25]|nr:unnamed protein product [Amoebophrya sp. A25]|eukprot:GSA25T00002340001.1
MATSLSDGDSQVENIVACATDHVNLLLQLKAGTLESLAREVDTLAKATSEGARVKAETLLRRLRKLARFAPTQELRDRCLGFCSQLHPSEPSQSSCGSGTIGGDRLLEPWGGFKEQQRKQISSICSFDAAEERDRPALDFEILESWSKFFVQNAGNLTSLHWAMSIHHGFLNRFYDSMGALFFEEGPLPKPWRHFLAMLAAAQHRCEYLVRHSLEMFLLAGGDRYWILTPSETVPAKLLRIAKLNELMAHQPWSVDENVLREMLSPATSAELRWSVPELLAALSILSTYHALSSLVFALALQLEDPRVLSSSGSPPGTVGGDGSSGAAAAEASSPEQQQQEPPWLAEASNIYTELLSSDPSLFSPTPHAAHRSPAASSDALVGEGVDDDDDARLTCRSFATVRSEQSSSQVDEAESTATGYTEAPSSVDSSNLVNLNALDGNPSLGDKVLGDNSATTSISLSTPALSKDGTAEPSTKPEADTSSADMAKRLQHPILDPSRLPACFQRNLGVNWTHFISKQEEQEVLNPIKSEKDWGELGKLTDNSLTDAEKKALQGVMATKPEVTSPLCDYLRARCCGSAVGSIKYVDFGSKSAAAASQTSWADHAFPLLAQFCPEIADAIHEEFEFANAYTDRSVGGQAVESTLPQRRALSAYVFRIYGLDVDDFNYTRLNFYLTLLHKVYLKKLVCFPEMLTREDYERLRAFCGYSLHDMIQYTHIATQVRRVMELQYVMAAFQKYQGGNASDSGTP